MNVNNSLERNASVRATYGDDWEERIQAFNLLSVSTDSAERDLAQDLRERVRASNRDIADIARAMGVMRG